MATRNITIDAKDMALGRVASQAAMSLMGKDTASFAPNVIDDVKVTIQNASQSLMNMDEKYARYSGYPGGLRFQKRGDLIEKRGIVPVFENAVRGMLPKNRLQALRMKNLIIEA